MQVRCGRRNFLAGAAAGLFASPAVPRAASARLAVLERWSTSNMVLSPPTADEQRLYFCGDAQAGAIDLRSKALAWQFAPPEGWAFAFRPRISGDRIVFGGRNGLAVHATGDGSRLWVHRAGIQTGVPMVNDQQVVFGDGHAIVALDLATGRERWRHAGVPDTLASYAPVQSGSTILAAPGDGRLYALDSETGSVRWQQDGREAWQYLRQLKMADGILVAGSYKEKLFGISVEDGRELWQFNAGNFINSQTVADGAAYLWSPTGFIYAIDVSTGAVRWRHETTDYDDRTGNWGPLMAELAVSGNKLLALDMFNVLHVLETEHGEAIGHWQIDAAIRHAVLPLQDGRLAFPTQAGEVIVTHGV